mmetsp:Transcript_14168/g.32623  ORF Transcript_14168/g.32623 Transcript_14168/m.32623 type:complete len:480 (-) Transcript_14168:714-2153(-)
MVHSVAQAGHVQRHPPVPLARLDPLLDGPPREELDRGRLLLLHHGGGIRPGPPPKECLAPPVLEDRRTEGLGAGPAPVFLHIAGGNEHPPPEDPLCRRLFCRCHVLPLEGLFRLGDARPPGRPLPLPGPGIGPQHRHSVHVRGAALPDPGTPVPRHVLGREAQAMPEETRAPDERLQVQHQHVPADIVGLPQDPFGRRRRYHHQQGGFGKTPVLFDGHQRVLLALLGHCHGLGNDAGPLQGGPNGLRDGDSLDGAVRGGRNGRQRQRADLFPAKGKEKHHLPPDLPPSPPPVRANADGPHRHGRFFSPIQLAPQVRPPLVPVERRLCVVHAVPGGLPPSDLEPLAGRVGGHQAAKVAVRGPIPPERQRIEGFPQRRRSPRAAAARAAARRCRPWPWPRPWQCVVLLLVGGSFVVAAETKVRPGYRNHHRLGGSTGIHSGTENHSVRTNNGTNRIGTERDTEVKGGASCWLASHRLSLNR